MADGLELELPFDSPYKLTAIYVKAGKASFGLWQPVEVQIDGDEETIVVQQGQEGQLDLFAEDLIGGRTRWRILAQVNKINNVAEEVVAGMSLVIPKLANVNAALKAAANQGSQNVGE